MLDINFIPLQDGQDIPPSIFENSVIAHKMAEYTGTDLFWSDIEMKECILMLISNVGLKAFIEMLPAQSRYELECLFLRQ